MTSAVSPFSAFSDRDVTIVIPSGPGWERAGVLERTLDGLARQTASQFDVIVVVDDTTAPPAGIARRVANGKITVLARPHDGPGPRRNAGARASERAIVLLLGDDTIPLPGLVARHVAVHAAHPEPETAVLGRVDWHPDSERGRLQQWLDWSRTQFDYDGIAADNAGWGRFYSSNLSIKREFLLDVGGFDETFTFGYEDTELGLRLDAKGLRLRYEPEARALHVHHYTWPGVTRRFALVGKGEQRMTATHPDFAPYFLHRVLHRRRAPWWAPWPWLVELVPRLAPACSNRPGAAAPFGAGTVRRMRQALEIRADAWYYARLSGSFLAGWTAAAEEAERRAFASGHGPGSAHAPAPAQSQAQSQAEQGHRPIGDEHTGQLLAELRRAVPAGGRLLDCNDDAGALGIPLLAAGYDVSFLRSSDGLRPGRDEQSRDLAFLRWRLATRGFEAAVYGPEEEPEGPFAAVYALGALERARHPVVRLAQMGRQAPMVVATVPDGPARHHALRGDGGHLVRYRRIGSRHLVVYRRERPAGRGAARAAIERVLGSSLPPCKAWTVDPRW